MQDDVDLELERDLMDMRSTAMSPHVRQAENKREEVAQLSLGGLASDSAGFMRATLSVSPAFADTPRLLQENTKRSTDQSFHGDSKADDDELLSETHWNEPTLAVAATPMDESKGIETRSGKDEKQTVPAHAGEPVDVSQLLIVEGDKKEMAIRAKAALEEFQREELRWSRSKRNEKNAQTAERPQLVLPKHGRSKELKNDSKRASMDDDMEDKPQYARKPPPATHIDSLQDRYLSILGRANQARREESAKQALAAAAEMAKKVNGDADIDEMQLDVFAPEQLVVKIPGQKVARVQ